MRLIDRFTRDEVSSFVWWPLALVCIVALLASVPLSHRAADDVRAKETLFATHESVVALQPLLSVGASSSDVSAAAAELVAADRRLAAVRVWNADHVLVASSDRSDSLGSSAALNDSQIDAAITKGPLWYVTDHRITGGEGPTTFYAYAPVSTFGTALVAEFEVRDAVLLADVHQDWLWFRIVMLLATLLTLGLAILSMREPRAKIGTGVPFYRETVPAYIAVMDVDRAVALEQAGARAKDRIVGLQERLDESERLRLKAEGDLQQALTLRNANLRAPGTAIDRPTPLPARSNASERRVPMSVPAAVVAAAPAAASKPRRQPRRRARPVTPAPAPAHDTNGWPEVVVLPETEPMHVLDVAPARVPVAAAAPAAAGAPASAPTHHGSDRDVLDVLNRLVIPGDEPDPLDDVSELRARLARTAAAKKPGSRERTEDHEGSQA
jgi:hypothetical protein